jgi:hypothetical protein
LNGPVMFGRAVAQVRERRSGTNDAA